jgi:hypothetical protein
MPKKKMPIKPLPRNWRMKISRITGLNFCDRNCDCGENSELWFYPPGLESRDMEDWVPCWMNGADTNDIWNWLVENGRV